MKKTRIIIAILIAIFFIIILSLITLLHTINIDKESENNVNKATLENENSIENIYYPSDTDSQYDQNLSQEASIDKKLKYENVATDYFTISALTENYINLIGNKDKERLKNILSNSYIYKYNINDNNILNVLSVPELTDYKQSYKINITEMLNTQINDDIYIYIVKANCRIVGKDEKFSIQVMFEVDTVNKIYNTYPTQYINDNGYNKLKAGDTIKYVAEEIKENENNKFTYITKTEAEIAKEYFNNYNELLVYYQDEAYNKLDTEYSKKRFESKQKFEEYVKENAKTLYLMQIDKYKVVSRDNYTDYVCSDKYNNIYIFRQQEGIMRYSVFLDNYTVMTDEDIEDYDKYDKFDKSKYNLTKFINMVNTKDYNAIYNVLDKTFRINNFKTVENLKKYINSNLYDLNSLEIDEYDDETYEYYVFNCKITNLRNTNENRSMTIIINQSEELDFTMSFSFN